MDINKLSTVIPAAVLAEIPTVMAKFQINTPLRLSHFLAQCAHESTGFKSLREILYYSNADRIMAVFNSKKKTYFADLATAQGYTKNAEKLGAYVYANRNGNGDVASNDGFNFRGRGYIQLTGKYNYDRFGKSVGDDLIANPDLVATKYPLLSAAFFFDDNKINPVSDSGSGDDVVKRVTLIVNGGLNGLDERIAFFKSYYALLQ